MTTKLLVPSKDTCNVLKVTLIVFASPAPVRRFPNRSFSETMKELTAPAVTVDNEMPTAVEASAFNAAGCTNVLTSDSDKNPPRRLISVL